MMDTSGIETGVGRTIQTLLEVRQETKVHFLVGTVILGFLSIFKKGKASSPFEALNSVCLSWYQSDVIPPIQMRRRTMVFSRVSTQESDIPHLGDATRACIQATSGKSDLISSQGISVSTQLEAAKSGSLSDLLLREVYS